MKKNRFLLLILLLLCIGVSKVSAKELKCYYMDDNHFNGANPVADGETFKSCSNSKTIDPGYTFVELKWETTTGKASFKFYDRSNKISTTQICVEDETGMVVRHYTMSTKKSGLSLTNDDFKNGCPNYIYRIYTPTDHMDDSSYTNYYVDNFKESTNKELYTDAFKTKLFESSMWSKYPESQNVSSVCFNETDPALLFNNANTEGGLGWIQSDWCGAVKNNQTPETINGNEDQVYKCLYFQDAQYDQTEAGNYQQKTLETHLSLDFSKEDGKFVSGYQYVNYQNMSANFNLSKNDKGNYVCPNTVYDCSGTIHNTNDCNSYIQYSLKKTLKPGDIAEIDNCAAFGVVGDYISGAYTLIRYLIPTLIVILSTADFVGVVFSGEQDKMEKAKYKFMMRLIIGVVALLIPFLFELILKLAGVIGGGESLADIACGFFG